MSKIHSFMSDGTVVLEDGHLFSARINEEGHYIYSDEGYEIYLVVGQLIKYKF